MNFERSVLVPTTPFGRDWRISIISALITIFGVLFLGWSVAAIVFLFFFEMIFIGAATLLRMLFSAHKEDDGFLYAWIKKLAVGSFFTMMYGTLLMLLIAFTLGGLNLDTLEYNFIGLKQAVWLAGANHLAGFLFGYLLNGAYKNTTPIAELFGTFFYALPLAAILLGVIAPNTSFVGATYQNQALAAAIIVLRLIMDFAAIKIRQHIRFSE